MTVDSHSEDANSFAKEQDLLRLFNEKVAKLDRLRFTQSVREEKIGFTINVKGDGGVEVHGPSEDEIDAFVLTLRFFVQDNEAISIRNVGELYASLPVSEDLKRNFASSRASINAALDGNANLILLGEHLTHRRVFDVFLYGGLAHANPTRRAEFDSWAKEEVTFAFLKTIFLNTVIELLRFLLWARHHNEKTLEALQSLTTE